MSKTAQGWKEYWMAKGVRLQLNEQARQIMDHEQWWQGYEQMMRERERLTVLPCPYKQP